MGKMLTRRQVGRLLLFVGLALGLGTSGLFAAPTVVVQLDPSYNQMLHFESSADQAITPARVLRWINSLLNGTPLIAETSHFEFQPIVHIRNNDAKIIAAIAYKF
jgi:hypothetical protein